MNVAIFVIDSVLFDSRHRQHLVPQYKADVGTDDRSAAWIEYWDRCVLDTPLPALTLAAALLNQGVQLVLTSGRPISMLKATADVVWDALLASGARQDTLHNIQFDLRVDGENYVDKIDSMITGLKAGGSDLIIALVKNNGLTSSLRKAWPLATVCNVTQTTKSRRGE